MRLAWAWLLAASLAACAGQDPPPATPQVTESAPLSDARMPLRPVMPDAAAANADPTAAARPALTYRAVLIAGSDDTAAFDNGTARMRNLLLQSGLARPEDIARFTSLPATEGAEIASAAAILRHIASLRPAENQACLVFFTSHGLPKRGLVIMTSRQMIGPDVLDRAVTSGCGDRPTLMILSGCFSGVFAEEPVARPNRVILTASRNDRPSFGCGAKDQYTYFDACLFDGLAHGTTWQAVFEATTTCVRDKEAERGFDPSEPRAWFGATAPALPIPVLAGPAATPASTAPPAPVGPASAPASTPRRPASTPARPAATPAATPARPGRT